MSDNKYEALTQLMKLHLDSRKLNLPSNLWRIGDSSVSGRGIFANRDIKTGEIILIDYPLIIGPRISNDVPYHCVKCSKSSDLTVCSKGCGLPVCSDNCENSSAHQNECELIRKWSIEKNVDEVSIELFCGLSLLRAFLLEENRKKLLTSLVSHEGRVHGFEVDFLKRKLKLEEDDERFMRNVCCILDTNTFETKVTIDDTQTSLKGLYPLSGLLNHSCVPNTTYLFDDDQSMIVKATVPIEKDSEIFDSYVDLLWGTVSRRHKLATTKHFWCQCRRCKDPREFDVCLSGLKCTSRGCQGVLLPLDSLDNSSKWCCDACQNLVTRQEIGIMQSALAGFMKTIDLSKIDDFIDFIENRLSKFVPPQSQIAVELKIRVMQILGNIKKYSWSVLTPDQLNYKEQLCKSLLQIMMDLQLGQCKLRGLILYELYRCQLEKCLRAALIDNLNEIKEMEQGSKRILKEAAEILFNDKSAPSEIKSFNTTENGTICAHPKI